jgi:hypothetical protein
MELREGEEQLEDLHTLTCFYLAQACLYLTSPHLTSPRLTSPRLTSPAVLLPDTGPRQPRRA